MSEEKYKAKEEAKIHKALKKLLVLADNPISSVKALKIENLMVMNESNILSITPKTEKATKILAKFMDKDYEQSVNMLNLDYDSVGKSTFSSEVVRDILTFLDVSDDEDRVRMKIGQDYPGTFSNRNFEIILAPIVEMI